MTLHIWSLQQNIWSDRQHCEQVVLYPYMEKTEK